MTWLVIARRDLLEDGIYPSTSTCIFDQDWKILKFKYEVLDEQTHFKEGDHPEGYNMLLINPVTYEVFWGYSSDFEFIEEKEKESKDCNDVLEFFVNMEHLAFADSEREYISLKCLSYSPFLYDAVQKLIVMERDARRLP